MSSSFNLNHGENEESNELNKKLDAAKNYGMFLQESGQKIVRAAELGKRLTKSIEAYKKFIAYDAAKRWLAQACATIPPQTPQNIQEIDKYGSLISTSMSAGTVFIMSQPIPHPVFDVTMVPVHEAELDNHLISFSLEYPKLGNLVGMRKGAWQVLASPVEENKLMAAHTIRDILTKIIAVLAPNDMVKNCPWWTHAQDTAEGVSEKQRLRFLLFGKNVEPNEARLKLIEDSVDHSNREHRKLKETAHGTSKHNTEEIEKAMRMTELTILAVLQARKVS